MSELIDKINKSVLSMPIWSNEEYQGIIFRKLDNFNDVYTFSKRLGSGTSGTVILYNGPNGPVAIKEVTLNHRIKISKQLREITMLEVLNDYPSFPKYYDHFIINRYGDKILCVLMEYIEGIPLIDYISDMTESNTTINKKIFLKIALWLTQTVAEMHFLGYVHRDIKPDNIMISGDRFLLIDLGDTCSVESDNTKYKCDVIHGPGTPYFLSPELLWDKSDFNYIYANKELTVLPPADVWAIGITLFELLHNKLPWTANDIRSLKYQTSNPTYRIPFSYPDDKIISILKLLLNRSSTLRISAKDAYIKFHELFLEYFP